MKHLRVALSAAVELRRLFPASPTRGRHDPSRRSSPAGATFHTRRLCGFAHGHASGDLTESRIMRSADTPPFGTDQAIVESGCDYTSRSSERHGRETRSFLRINALYT